MEYENPDVDHAVNVSNEHPLKEFSQLIVGLGLLFALAIGAVSWFSDSLVKHVPFSYESKLISHLDLSSFDTIESAQELQALADRLVRHMDLPEQMTVRVHRQNQETINAYATLAGNIVFFKGLLDAVESEDELAMVMAHEIAHVKLRHPITAISKGISLGILASFVTGFSGNNAGQWLFGSSARLSVLSYSRAQELAADKLAAQALVAEYGHILGAKKLFQRFAALENQSVFASLETDVLRSHPHSKDRWRTLQDLARIHAWPVDGTLTQRPAGSLEET